MLTNHVIGKRSYELSNHLGNVLSTISDVIATTVIDDTLIAPTITGHGISVSGDMITRTLTPDNTWGDAGGSSSQTVNEGDTLIWTLGGPSFLNNRFIMCGLSYTNTDDDYTTIDYCWYTYGTAGLYVYELGAPYSYGGYDTGHTLKIARVGGNIEYYHNGSLIRTVADAHPDQPMVIDFSMYEATRYIYQLRIAKKAVVYSAQIRSSQDYSPFGVTLEGRSFVKTGAEKDRYGFNGKEGDSEIKGTGDSYDYVKRFYDPRLGKFLSLDDHAAEFPWNSPYAFAENCVIRCIDLDGLEKLDMVVTSDPNTTTGEPGRASLKITKSYMVVTEGLGAVSSAEKIDPEDFAKNYRRGNIQLFVSALPTSTADAAYLSDKQSKLAQKAENGDEKAMQQLKDQGINYYVLDVKYDYSITKEAGITLADAVKWQEVDVAERGVISLNMDKTDLSKYITDEGLTPSQMKDFFYFNKYAQKAFIDGDDVLGAGTISSLEPKDIIYLNRDKWKDDANFDFQISPNDPLRISISRTEVIVHEAGHNSTDLGHQAGYGYADDGLSSNQSGLVYPTKDNTKTIISSPANRSNLTTTK